MQYTVYPRGVSLSPSPLCVPRFPLTVLSHMYTMVRRVRPFCLHALRLRPLCFAVVREVRRFAIQFAGRTSLALPSDSPLAGASTRTLSPQREGM